MHLGALRPNHPQPVLALGCLTLRVQRQEVASDWCSPCMRCMLQVEELQRRTLGHLGELRAESEASVAHRVRALSGACDPPPQLLPCLYSGCLVKCPGCPVPANHENSTLKRLARRGLNAMVQAAWRGRNHPWGLRSQGLRQLVLLQPRGHPPPLGMFRQGGSGRARHSTGWAISSGSLQKRL